MTIPEIQKYIENLAKLQASGQPYSIDYTEGIVRTAAQDYHIHIPDVIISDITLEEI